METNFINPAKKDLAQVFIDHLAFGQIVTVANFHDPVKIDGETIDETYKVVAVGRNLAAEINLTSVVIKYCGLKGNLPISLAPYYAEMETDFAKIYGPLPSNFHKLFEGMLIALKADGYDIPHEAWSLDFTVVTI